ncbi:bcl-2-like protein 15 [Talpa occidentalis]|uniref:bcl-2-like protein 15 n=1 Tax=Talpa occidentalis TaxID=50954 RepID=UPI00188E64A1|nr:bcl-2-like protein 15 [Talpa occidentalis]
MKNSLTFEEQTECIISYLLEDILNPQAPIASRSLSCDCETDSGGAGFFDEAIIAGRLRMLADEFNKEVETTAQAVITEFTQEKAKAILQDKVKSLCAQDSTLASERAFLGMLVKLVVCVAEKAPEIARQLVTPMTTMINENSGIRDFIKGEGGWEHVESC